MFGVMNADPRYFENASLLNQISYRAIELAFMAQRSFCSRFKKKGNSFVCKIVYKPIANGTSVSKEST
jgi:aspartate kinase